MISEFLNMIAVAWFTGGVITPIFMIDYDIKPFLPVSLVGTLLFLSASVYLIKDYDRR